MTKTHDNTPIENTDDPRLTAYALGELEGPSAEAVARYVESSPEAQAVVEEVRLLAGVLSEELTGEPADAEPGLDAGRRAVLEQALAGDASGDDAGGAIPVNGRRHPKGLARVLPLWLPAAAAAVLVVAVAIDWTAEGGGGGGGGLPHALAPDASPKALMEPGVRDQLAANHRSEPAKVLDEGNLLRYRNSAYPQESSVRGSTPGGAAPSDNAELAQMGYAGKDRYGARQEVLRELGYTGDTSGSVSAGKKLSAGTGIAGGQGGGGGGNRVDSLAAHGRAVDAPLSEESREDDASMGRVARGEGRRLGGAAGDGGDTLAKSQPAQDDSPIALYDDAASLGTPFVGHVAVEGAQPVTEGDVALFAVQPSNTIDAEALQDGFDSGYEPEIAAAATPAAPATSPSGAASPAPAQRTVVGQGSGTRVSMGGSVRGGGRVARGGAAREESPPDGETLKLLRGLGYLDGPGADRDDARRAYERPATKPERSRESYAPIHENPFVPLTGDPVSALSTFGLDVDTASYANVRRFLNRNERPPADAVRLEELINRFDYDLPQPEGEHPFSVTVQTSEAPWAPSHRLVRVGLAGREIVREQRPVSNLVFLVDVSGSMKSQDKLPLLVNSLELLVDELEPSDRVAIVTYASGTRVALEPTPGDQKERIVAALRALSAGGSTHASAGIQKAYELARQHFDPEGSNRVVLATDGDFNVGVTTEGQLETLIKDQARSGVFLTVLGFGTGNLQDSKAEILADRGNGNYAYIDSLNEAHKVLVRELGATLHTIAKDVKLQVEFNPGRVAAYRLLGYENRALAARDFRDDTKDAGEMGAGHTVVALYEVVPVGAELEGAVALKYQAAPVRAESLVDSPELLTVNLRYKLPDEDTGREFAVPLVDAETSFAELDDDFRWSAAVASFGMILRGSAHAGSAHLGQVYDWAAAAVGEDPHGDRAEFLRLVRAAQGLGY